MIKHLRFFMLNLLVLVSAAVMAQTTIDFTKLTWSNPLVQSPYTFSADKNSGSTTPTQNPNSKDIRLYAKNSLTISTSSGKICKIVFHISTNGLKQWADFTPNNGSVTVSKEKQTATWENAEGATSVTFTVGAKCKYGTAATTKAGQFFFNSVDITELGGTSSTSTSLTFGADVDGKTFTVRQGDNFGGGLQLKRVYDSDATQQGYVVSPTFSKFPYGYRVTVKYKDSNAPELECVNYSDKVAVTDDANGTITMDVPFADGTFKLLGGSKVAYVQSIELTPLAKKEATTMTFPQEEYTLNIGEEFTAPTATVKGEDGKTIEGLKLLYTSDNKNIAVVDENTGEVLLGDKAGTATITAYFHGNEKYAACKASYKINVTKKEPQPVTMTFPQDVYTCYTNEAPLFDGFQPTIKDEAGNDLKLPVTYSSSNVDFCMVTGSGTVLLSQNPGEVTITAKFAGNDDYLPAQASYVIKVIKKEKKDAGISFEDTMIMIDLANPNTTVKDLGFLNPNNLAVTYSSNKTDVAEVDAEGNVTLKKAGRVNIDVTFAGNDEYKAASASCTLIVNDYRTTPELSFDQEEYTANMREGNTFSGATLYNELEVAPLSYTSSNEEVAEVAANGVVILRSTGETTITVWFAGDKNFKAASASYKLKVVDEVVNGIQNITIDNMPEDAKVYNLNGQRVNTKALKSGVYVVNGKKVVLK